MNASLTHLLRRVTVAGSTLLCLALAATLVQAAPAPTGNPVESVKRPKIGLVLAGGGAKGAAHVGVLKVLEEMRIPIDYVAGTSMGSIVGGLYASGMSAAQIEHEMLTIAWGDVFNDEPLRQDRSYRRKQDDALYVFKAKPGFNDGEVQLPLAAVHGQKFSLQLNRLLMPVAQVRNFDELPIPYRAVATDLETGQEVILGKGTMSGALRASMAVPGAFDPVDYDGKMLVDGGISNNVPVSVARAMGADIVIVSDLGSDLLTREQITSALSVAGQMVNFLFALNSQKQLASLTDKDVLISNKLGDIGAGSFDRIAEAIPVGDVAARKVADALRRYSLSADAYARHVAARSVPDKTPHQLAFVKVANQSRLSDDVIRNYIEAKPGEPLDIPQMERNVQELYGLEVFESVRYEIKEEDGKTGVVVHAKEKPWGPGYLQTGLITSSNFEGDAAFRLGLAYTLTPLNALNGELRLAGQVGDEPGAFAEIFQPLDPGARYFANGKLGFSSQNINSYDADGHNVSENRAKFVELDLALGRQFGTWGEFRMGYTRATGDIEVKTGPPAPARDFDTGEVYLRLSADKLDNPYFPTEGHLARAEWRASREAFGSDSDYDQLKLGYLQAYKWGGDSIIGGVNLRSTIDDNAPLQRQFRMGGFLNLSGFALDELTGQQAAIAKLIYMHRLTDMKFFRSYAGVSLEAGNVWQRREDISLNNSIIAGSIFVGADTPLGPVYFGYGRNDTGVGSAYLTLGPLFSF